ncbi:hypothetical protein [Psychroserpens sp. SPM9]|uniref:hypothetical protein n=1 Tax=Psychroserpens sp. SPM9 TaxID=2975598 RepID=UPI0021A57095|nr:hypothetical protein [Psychroserpens sp. SPM9]MDG5493270.1 hypothetical protein [Psychroserpens sp. SPM9]
MNQKKVNLFQYNTKLNRWIVISISSLFFGCQTDQNISGNYYSCSMGEYTEVYFKQDSMRVASKSEWVKLTEWRKIDIKNDTLYFESFGEWRDKWKAEISYVGMNKIEMYVIENKDTVILYPLSEDPNFENLDEFWNGFNNRQNSNNCE